MNSILRFSTLFLLISFIIACRIDTVNILQKETSLTILRYTYTLKPSPVIKTTISKESKQYSQLLTWLENNQEGWQPSYIDFAPDIIVKGNYFNINFQRTQAVLNYEVSDGKWRQYVKKIKEEDYSFLIK